MNLATGHALGVLDIFNKFNIKKLKITAKECEKLIGSRHKEILAAKIWKSFVYLVLKDIIKNSITFLLPLGKRRAELYVKSYDRELFTKGRLRGKWQDIDFLVSNFTGYQLVFKYQKTGYMVDKPIYINLEMKDEMVERINSGKSYY